MPSQPRQLTANSFQSPYLYRASGLLQIAVSALLRTSSLGAREVLAAEHCRYGTRDLASTDSHAEGQIRNFDPGEPSLVAKRGHADLNAHPWIAELQNAKARELRVFPTEELR